MESLSLCELQANCQPEPPIAHAPYPTGVICRSELPSCRFCISISCNFGFAGTGFDAAILCAESLCGDGALPRPGGSKIRLHTKPESRIQFDSRSTPTLA